MKISNLILSFGAFSAFALSPCSAKGDEISFVKYMELAQFAQISKKQLVWGTD